MRLKFLAYFEKSRNLFWIKNPIKTKNSQMQKLESQYFSTPTSTLKKVSIISVIFISHVQSMKSLNVSYQYSRESKIVLRIFFEQK